MANIFEFLSKDGNITPEKARKSRQMPFHDKTAYVWMGMLPLKKRVNRDKCSFATKQRMFGVFAIDEILRYRWTRFVSSRTLCHPVAWYCMVLHGVAAAFSHLVSPMWTLGDLYEGQNMFGFYRDYFCAVFLMKIFSPLQFWKRTLPSFPALLIRIL